MSRRYPQNWRFATIFSDSWTIHWLLGGMSRVFYGRSGKKDFSLFPKLPALLGRRCSDVDHGGKEVSLGAKLTIQIPNCGITSRKWARSQLLGSLTARNKCVLSEHI